MRIDNTFHERHIVISYPDCVAVLVDFIAKRWYTNQAGIP